MSTLSMPQQTTCRHSCRRMPCPQAAHCLRFCCISGIVAYRWQRCQYVILRRDFGKKVSEKRNNWKRRALTIFCVVCNWLCYLLNCMLNERTATGKWWLVKKGATKCYLLTWLLALELQTAQREKEDWKGELREVACCLLPAQCDTIQAVLQDMHITCLTSLTCWIHIDASERIVGRERRGVCESV